MFGLAPIGPAVFAADAGLDPDSKLPPCCRRAGEHGCALAASRLASFAESSSGPAVRADLCASFPEARGIPAQRTVTFLVTSQAVFAEVVRHPASRPQTEALLRISHSRAGQKRGPPLQFS